MLITTPLLYLALFLIGVFRSFIEIIKRRFRLFREDKKRNDLLFLSWFFIPLLAVIVFRSVVYDSWRHLYFIYPAFLMMSLKGTLVLWASLKSRGRAVKVLRPIYILIIFLSLTHTAALMILNHPFQNVYFNSLAGSHLRANWELDYWGLSYRQALEYILRHDRAEQISVYAANYPGELNQYILKPEDRKRLAYSSEPEGASYVVSNYRWHREDYPYPDEIYSITVGRAKIMSVFKLK
jgi:4-amino-4-deoxy-L-arabinose transferase-like glycosyltransferase